MRKFKLYHGENKLHSMDGWMDDDDDDVQFVLYQHDKFDFIWLTETTGRHVASFGNITVFLKPNRL